MVERTQGSIKCSQQWGRSGFYNSAEFLPNMAQSTYYTHRQWPACQTRSRVEYLRTSLINTARCNIECAKHVHLHLHKQSDWQQSKIRFVNIHFQKINNLWWSLTLWSVACLKTASANTSKCWICTDNMGWILDMPKASLSTCYLEFTLRWQSC